MVVFILFYRQYLEIQLFLPWKTYFMSQPAESDLNQKIVQLDSQNQVELHLFVDFLLLRQKQKKRGNTKKKAILADLEVMEMPVDNLILNRETLYGDRIKF